jgi:hypothetical protein
MASLCDVAAEAQNDLFEIWRRIAGDSVELANHIESEFYEFVWSKYGNVFCFPPLTGAG